MLFTTEDTENAREKIERTATAKTRAGLKGMATAGNKSDYTE